MKKTCALLFFALVLLQNSLLMAQSIKAIIHSDGTFDIVGTSVKITNCYPALEKRLLKSMNVKIVEKANTKTIHYQLKQGAVELQFGYEGNALAVNMKVTGLPAIPEMISILRDGEVTGASKIYRTSSQIMGNGGIKDWPINKTDYSSCSGITGLIADAGATMVISTRNYKKYISYVNVLPTDRNGGKKLVEACLSTEKISTANIPTFYFTEHASAFDAMKNEAAEASKVMGAKNDKPQSYHWCSWYYAYYHLTDKMLSEYLQGFKKMKPPVNIQTIQIDAGYHPHVGDWLEPSHKFPNGLQASVTEILNNGYRAGIWIGPYMVGNKSKLYLEHPDWIIRNLDGSPLIQMSFYAEERLWGAMDEEIYVLDTSNPEVMAHLRKVFRTFKSMGITFFKTDFMLNGSINSNSVKRFAPGKTSLEYQAEFFDMIRQEIGPESFWLGCIAPFGPMVGYVDAMRISADIHPHWKGGTSMFEETKGNQHLNNVWWQNDPDAMIIREKYSQLSTAETKSMALWMGMLGGVINTSDLFYDIPKERTALFQFIEPSKNKLTCYFPFLDTNPKIEVLVRKYNDKSWAVLFTNRQEETMSATYSLQNLVGVVSANCTDWDETKTDKMGVKNELLISLKAHESKLIYVATDGTSPQNMTLGGKVK